MQCIWSGWGLELPPGVTFRGGKAVTKYNFNGASLDQVYTNAHIFVYTVCINSFIR